MNAEAKEIFLAAIENKTGIVFDGKVSTGDIIAGYKAGLEILEEVFPDAKDEIDTYIDKIEERAKSRKKVTRVGITVLCSGIRKFLNCPDDDDNTVQK